jgi:hypothetical protein
MAKRSEKRDDNERGSRTPAPYVAPPAYVAPSTPATPATNYITPPTYGPAAPAKYLTESLKTISPYMVPESAGALYKFYGMDTSTPPGFSGTKETLGTTGLRNYYLSKQRGDAAIQALDAMKAASGISDLGPGYTFLRNAVSLLQTYGAEEGGGMSRDAYNKMSEELNVMLSQAKTDAALEPFANIAQSFVKPDLATGTVMPKSTLASGKSIYGSSNSKLWT